MRVQILVDNPDSWMVPHAGELCAQVRALGHDARLLHDPEAVEAGDVLVLLSCERRFRDLAKNTHNLVVHESALPEGRGWSPLTWQILAGKSEIPITLFEAVEAIDEITEVDGIDCLFVGRIDLTVAYGAKSPQEPIVVNAVKRICQAAVKSNTPVGMFVSDVSESSRWIDEGASLFLLDSDQGFVSRGADKLYRDFNSSRSDS